MQARYKSGEGLIRTEKRGKWAENIGSGERAKQERFQEGKLGRFQDNSHLRKKSAATQLI